jgi:hypothetical protein
LSLRHNAHKGIRPLTVHAVIGPGQDLHVHEFKKIGKMRRTKLIILAITITVLVSVYAKISLRTVTLSAVIIDHSKYKEIDGERVQIGFSSTRIEIKKRFFNEWFVYRSINSIDKGKSYFEFITRHNPSLSIQLESISID